MSSRGSSSHSGGGAGANGQSYTAGSYKRQIKVAEKMGITLNINEFIAKNIIPANVTEALKGIKYMYKMVPEMKGFIKEIKTTDSVNSPNAYASMGNGVLSLGYYGTLRLPILEGRYSRDVSQRWHPEGTTWRSIIYHEFGHAMEIFVGQERFLPRYRWGTAADRILLRAAQRYFDEISVPLLRRAGSSAESIAKRRPKTIRDVQTFASGLSQYAVSGISSNWTSGIDYNTAASWATWETLAEAVGEYAERQGSARHFSQYVWSEFIAEVKKK